MLEKPLNHQVNVVRIPEPRVHTNADSLELFDIGGYQVVAKKGEFKPGDLAVYIQPDSVVPQTQAFRFIWDLHVGIDLKVPAKYRRITVRRFRKEWSEGLLMPLADFGWQQGEKDGKPFYFYENGVGGVTAGPEGWDVSDILGITHYEPEEDLGGVKMGMLGCGPKRKKRYPVTVKDWLRYFYYHSIRFLTGGRFYRQEASMVVPFDAPEYDVVSMKAARSVFRPDEFVIVTEKLHGSNSRYVFLEGVMYVGSHFQWKHTDSPCIFNRVLKQHPWIEEWCRANEGRILYGEIVGDQKDYPYGCNKQKGELDFRAFDIRELNGTWTKPWTEPSGLFNTLSTKNVPILYSGVADIDVIKSLTDGVSKIDGKTPREGIVISEMEPAAFGHRRARQVKRVSNAFLEKDSK
jgi:hypothetical protein